MMPVFEIVSVRAERVQSITRHDAMAEGVRSEDCPLFQTPDDAIAGNGRLTVDFVEGFRALWNSINNDRGYGWDANPWVWRVAFTRVLP